MKFFYDLHIHSCLSPCAEDDMSVNNIANMAMICGLDIIALTDHNSLKNCPPFFTACGRAGVVPIAGVEVNTREEVHVLCLFPSLESGMDFDVYLESLLPHFMNNPRIFGRQIIVDENDEPIGEEEKLLYAACDIGTDELPDIMRRYGGVAIPSHIDRPSNSLLANLGFVTHELGFTCYEIQSAASFRELITKNPALDGAGIIYNSDAHSLTDIAGKQGAVELRERSAAALIETLSAGRCDAP